MSFVVTGSTDSASGRATRTGDANRDVRNRRIRLVPSNNPGHYNPGIGWFRAERQCRKQHRKGDKYSFHIYKVLNVRRGVGLRESGAARPTSEGETQRSIGVMECRSNEEMGLIADLQIPSRTDQ